MSSFFIWLASLSLVEGISLFITVALLMVIMPYYSLLKKIVSLYISGQTGEIELFNYTITNDHLIGKIGEKEYYLHPTKPGFVLNGGKVLLTWVVKGAFRVDLNPIKKDVTGNSAIMIITEENCKFELIAYTLKGKLKAQIEIPIENIKSLETEKIVDNNKWLHKKNAEIRTFKYSRLKSDKRYNTNNSLKPTKSKFDVSYVFQDKGINKVFDKIKLKYIGLSKDLPQHHLNNYLFNSGKLNFKGYKPSRFNKVTSENFFNKVKSNE